MNIQFLLEAIDAGKTDNPLGILYGTSPEVLQTQRLRYQRAIRRFAEIFPGRDDVQLFSAPG
ncbi:MAG: galactokinase, partial [Ruminococcus sp.]|nr:galactokinase [Ruminococcus sp.]